MSEYLLWDPKRPLYTLGMLGKDFFDAFARLEAGQVPQPIVDKMNFPPCVRMIWAEGGISYEYEANHVQGH